MTYQVRGLTTSRPARGASCLGPRSGLEAQREQYQAAVAQLADPQRTTLVLSPARSKCAARSRPRWRRAGAGRDPQPAIGDQRPVRAAASGDRVAEALAERHRDALQSMPASLHEIPMAGVPLVALDLTGVAALRALASGPTAPEQPSTMTSDDHAALPDLNALVDELERGGPEAILVMGKGGVGRPRLPPPSRSPSPTADTMCSLHDRSGRAHQRCPRRCRA